MSALLWWLIPVGATILAVAWAMYRARPERPTEAIEGMEHLRRMQMAMERPLPQDAPIPEVKQRRLLSRRSMGSADAGGRPGGAEPAAPGTPANPARDAGQSKPETTNGPTA